MKEKADMKILDCICTCPVIRPYRVDFSILAGDNFERIMMQ